MSVSYRTHKIALSPTAEQEVLFRKASGIARFAWNWALREWQNDYEAWKTDNALQRPSAYALVKRFTLIKREEYPWVLEVSKNVPQYAILHVGEAFSRFFKGTTKYPRFKSKHRSRDSFVAAANSATTKTKGKTVHLPRIGWVKMREELRLSGEPISVTVCRTADRWFAAILVRSPTLDPVIHTGPAVGVDLGITDLAVLSDGKKIKGPRPLRKSLKKLQRLARLASRKQKGSNNRKKANLKLACHHAKVANIRNDALHKLTTMLTRQYSLIGIETLNVKGMVKNHRLARAISDMGFFEFRRQLEYKAKRTGSTIVFADRFYPSSKTCSACGGVQKALPLSVRNWTCPCGANNDRDINAAINLKNLAVSSTVSACGVVGSKSATLKQEFVLETV